MELGIVGLGRMGAGMARRLARGGAHVVCYDRAEGARRAIAAEPGVDCVENLAALCARLAGERVILMMLPAGDAVEGTLRELLPLASSGDTLVDGGNANYHDSQRRGEALRERGLRFSDCGVSGGVHGLANGYALMFGADAPTAAMIEPYVRLLAPAPDAGWVHCGPVGAGHFAKMIHNGIEYGMMQALAEGFALMENRRDLGLDVAKIARAWQHGSVVRSWLLDLTAEFLAADPHLAGVAPVVADSGEGRWTVEEAIAQGVPAPVLSLALMMRFASQGRGDYADRMLAMMRNAFGGHALARTQDER